MDSSRLYTRTDGGIGRRKRGMRSEELGEGWVKVEWRSVIM